MDMHNRGIASAESELKTNKANNNEGFDSCDIGIVILLKLDSNRRFFSLSEFEIWRMT